MKYIAFPALLALAIACNSSKNDKPADKPADTAGIIHNPDTASTKPEPVITKADIEHLGDLRLGMPADSTENIAGKPDSKSKPEKWGADEMMHETWKWKDKGLEINVVSDPRNAAAGKQVFSITASTLCPYKTKAGIGVGSTMEEIQAAYKDQINKEESGDDQVIIGSMYGGIIFTMQNNKVLHVFVGAAAE